MRDKISLINKNLKQLPLPKPKLDGNVLKLFSLKGKVASITGSSSGIGFYVAEAFAQAGADVAIWYNSKVSIEKAESLSKKYGVRSKAYKCNISDAEQVEKVINDVEKDFGTIDIFVANAGVPWKSGPILDTNGYEDWKKIIDLNLNGVYYCCKNVGKIFKKNKKGNLIVTSSISGQIVNVPQMQAPYNASKAAVTHLVKSLAVEWGGFARVNSVSPGYTDTEITNVEEEIIDKWNSLTPMGRNADPRELVGAYLYLASDALTYTTGADIVVDGGYTCF